MKNRTKRKPMSRFLAMLICVIMVFGILPVISLTAEISDPVAEASIIDGIKSVPEPVSASNSAITGLLALNRNNIAGAVMSPPTGDDADVALWAALLFFSTGAIITLLVFGRPKKRRKTRKTKE